MTALCSHLTRSAGMSQRCHGSPSTGSSVTDHESTHSRDDGDDGQGGDDSPGGNNGRNEVGTSCSVPGIGLHVRCDLADSILTVTS